MGLARTAPWWLGALLVVAPPAEARQRSALPGQRAGAPDTESVQETEEVRILVVDREGRPLPDAEVRFALEDEHGGSMRDDTRPGGWRQALRLEQAPRSSSVDGLLRHRPITPLEPGARLRVRWTKGRGLLVAGREGTRWGFRWFPRDWRETTGRERPAGEPLRLELAEDWDLRVRVEDPSGRPLESLGVTLQSPGPGGGLRWGAPSSHVFEHVGFDLRDTSEPLEVRVGTLLLPPVSVALDPRQAPEQPVVLRLPPTGSVEVIVLGPDGGPTKENGYVTVSIASNSAGASLRFDQVRAGVSATVVQGKARFDGVSLGQELEVSLNHALPVAVRGPSWAGETVTLTLSDTGPVREEAFTPEPVPYPVLDPRSMASVAGSVRLDPDIAPEDVLAVLHGRNGLRENAALLPDGSFRFEDVEVGAWQLELVPKTLELHPPEDRPVFRARIDLVAGENPAPELDGIDLRGKLFRRELRLTGLDSTRPFHARVFLSAPLQGLSNRVYLHLYQQPLVFVTPWERLEVELFAPGYRSLSVPCLGPRTEARLEPGITVRLRLVTDGILPEPPHYLKALLLSTDDPERGYDWEGPAFGPTRELVTTAWAPGPAKVRWIAAEYHEGGGHATGGWPEVSPPQVLEIQDIRDPSVEQVFTVTIPANNLARLMARLDD